MRRRLNRRNGGYVGDWRLQDQAGTITPMTPLNQLNKTTEWYRPSYWLPMPEMTEGSTQMFAGLYAIFKGASGAPGASASADSNFVAFLCRGAYVVDWGITTAARPNGLTTAHADNTVASYNYNWNDVPASTETPNGYRQVMIKVTPSGAANLTTINLNQRYTTSPVSISGFSSNAWLSIKISAPSLATFTFGSPSPTGAAHLLEEFEFVGTISGTSISDWFNSSVSSLQCIRGTKFSTNVATCNSSIGACISLRRFPLIDTRKFQSNTHSIFNGCTNLEVIPPLNFQGVFDSNIIAYNSSLANTSVLVFPRWSFQRVNYNPSATNGVAGMFNTATRLKRADNITDVSRVRDAAAMFNGCYSLVKPPDRLNFGLTFAGAAQLFTNCYSLGFVPAGMCLANINTATSMFSGMRRCSVFPTDVVGSGLTATGLTADQFASNTSSGMVAPRLNYEEAINVNRAYLGSAFPEIVGGVVTTGWAGANAGRGICFGWGANAFAYQATALKILPKFQGLCANIDLRNQMASPTELDAFFTALGTIPTPLVAGSTIGVMNISGNWGLTYGGRTPPGASLEIATSKGWTFTNA